MTERSDGMTRARHDRAEPLPDDTRAGGAAVDVDTCDGSASDQSKGSERPQGRVPRWGASAPALRAPILTFLL